MSITVGELKDILQNALDNLDDYEDDEKVSMVSNTYFLGHANHFLGISGYDGGYLDLNNIEIEEEDDDDEGEDE